MRLDEYQWSHNPRGLHVIGAFQTPVEFDRYTRPHMGWAKLLAATTDFVDDAIRFQELGITPIVRLYLGEWGAKPFDSHLQGITEAFIAAGVRWFEFYNEPNLGVEWPSGFNPDWRDRDNVIRPLMDNWLSWAEYMVSRGCYPGFIPLAESDTLDRSSVLWMDAFLNYLGETHFQRFQAVLNSGMYAATHPYILNHFYQEVPGGGPLSARPPAQQRGDEGGWHFEYPYDPICQTNDPGRTVFGGTSHTPYGDPVGLLAMGYMFNQRANEWFGAQAVPVVGTEGGIWTFRGQSYQQDTRYPPYNEQSQGEATRALFDWISTSAPPWFFGLTLWKEDDYYSPNNAPAIDKLSASQPIPKQVPPTEVLGPNAPSLNPLNPPGPGPIDGEPDNHLLLLAPGLDMSWCLDTAQAYWNTFRPMISDRSELIALIPATQSLAVTVIAPPDMEATLRASIERAYPNVLFDLVLATDKAAVSEVLNNRVRAGTRFGSVSN